MKINWINRQMAYPGPYLTLCTTEKQYIQALKDCGVRTIDDWIVTSHADATTHRLYNTKGNAVCIVCIRPKPETTAIEIAGLLVHESVHVVQGYFAQIGEHLPATEQYAYAVQGIAQELMSAYAESIT